MAKSWARASGGACGVLLLLAACASPAPPKLEIAPQALLDRRLDDPRLQRFIESESRQANSAGRATDDWDLERLTLAALYFHPDLTIARSRLQMAQAHAQTARSKPGPGLSATLGRGAGGLVASPWVVGAAIDFLLEPGDRRDLRVKQADALVGAAQADLRQASWQVRARVYAVLLDYWSAQRRVDPLKQQLDLQSHRAELLERRVAAGENPRADLRRELALREQLAAGLAQAQTDLAAARVGLAQAIAVPVAALDPISLSIDWLDGAPQFDLAQVDVERRRDALTRRADIGDALFQLDAAQADLQAELSRRWPDLHLGPGYQYDLGANKYTVSMSLDWPRSRDGPVGEAAARRELAAAELLASQARVLSQIEYAVAAWQAAVPMLQSARAVTEHAQAGEQVANRLFDSGAIDRPALLAARIDRIESQRAGRIALERQRRALAALEDALQAPLEPGRREPVAP